MATRLDRLLEYRKRIDQARDHVKRAISWGVSPIAKEHLTAALELLLVLPPCEARRQKEAQRELPLHMLLGVECYACLDWFSLGWVVRRPLEPLRREQCPFCGHNALREVELCGGRVGSASICKARVPCPVHPSEPTLDS